ncbi:MAG TPA: T9SS type A sorting domain-containing protein, partial [Brumimicrobium sp.]|nr:T9SS type A sorting domain-containing protein [Brumimicrobium sp.]
NPAVVTINIPGDITVNNGQNIESIVIQEVVTEASIMMDLGGFPLPMPADCGDLISYSLALDGTITIPETCDADFQGQDVTSNATVQLSTDLSLFTSLFPLTMDIKVTLAITYSTCSADAGEDTTIEPCKNEPIVLFDALDGTPQTGGVWIDHNNNEVTDASITTPNLPGSYIYTYTVETSSDCFDETVLFIDVQDCDYLSIEEELLANISLYPNPTNGLLNIEGLTDGNYELSIVDVNGRIVKAANTYTTNTSLDMTDIQNGVYLVRIKKNDAERVIRIVKK